MRRTQAERRATTKAALIAAARKLFGELGFTDVSIEEIAREAGVTRGALYHHFDSKEDLFTAVFEDVERELMGIAAIAAAGAGDPLASLRAGSRAFLDAVSRPAMQRIVLLDAPAVLGWPKWREIDLKYALRLVTGGLNAAIAAGQMRPRAVETTAHILLGAITEAALLLGSGDGSPEQREQVFSELDSLLEGLR